MNETGQELSMAAEPVITVVARLKGQHGTVAPLAELQRTVRQWLYDNIFHSEDSAYTLEVEAKRISVKSDREFVKASAMSEYSNSVIEIRAHPAGEAHQWYGYLVCPSDDHATQVFFHDKPELANHVLAMKGREMPDRGGRETIKKNRHTRRKTGEHQKRKAFLTSYCTMHKREILRKISSFLQVKLGEKNDVLSSQDVCNALIEACNLPGLQLFDMPSMTFPLMLGGILLPGPNESTYRFTDLGREYAEDWRNRELDKQRETAETRLRTSQKLLEAAKKERTRLEAKIVETNRQIEQLAIQENELKQKVKSLERPGSSTPTEHMFDKALEEVAA